MLIRFCIWQTLQTSVFQSEFLVVLRQIHVFQALLTGCSAGGLATIIHCDEFAKLFPSTTKVKCLSDGGFFVDA